MCIGIYYLVNWYKYNKHYGNTGCGVFKRGVQNKKDMIISIAKGYSPPTAAPTMHDTFLDVIGSNSATFLNKDANLLMFETIFNMHCLILARC